MLNDVLDTEKQWRKVNPTYQDVLPLVHFTDKKSRVQSANILSLDTAELGNSQLLSALPPPHPALPLPAQGGGPGQHEKAWDPGLEEQRPHL